MEKDSKGKELIKGHPECKRTNEYGQCIMTEGLFGERMFKRCAGTECWLFTTIRRNRMLSGEELEEMRIKKAVLFVEHIEEHINQMNDDEKGHGKVMCKICSKTIDEIYEENK